MERKSPRLWRKWSFTAIAAVLIVVTATLVIFAARVRSHGVGAEGMVCMRGTDTSNLLYDRAWTIDQWGRIELGYSWSRPPAWETTPRQHFVIQCAPVSLFGPSPIAAKMFPSVSREGVQVLGLAVERVMYPSQNGLQIRFAAWHTALAAIPFAWVAARMLVHKRPPGHCESCGYDLRASPTRCPECGLEPAQPKAVAAA